MKEEYEIDKSFDDQKQSSEIEGRLDQVELSLIEQEHRLIPAVLNIFKKWEKKKERLASIKALVFVLFSTQTATAAGVTVTAIAGIIIAIWANDLIDQQNKLIDLQNKFVERQTFLAESNRRSALTFELSSILDEIDEELDLIEETDINLKNSGFRYLSERFPIVLSPRLQGRIIAVSNSLKPYKYLDENGMLTRPLSPERGQLLISIILSNIEYGFISDRANFAYSDLERNDFRTKNLSKLKLQYANLKESSFYSTKLISTIFFGADLKESDFRYSNLSYADLRSANIIGCNFEGAYLPNVNMFQSTIMDSINLQNLIVLDSLWLDKFFELPNAPKNYQLEDFEIFPGYDYSKNFYAFQENTRDITGKVIYNSEMDTTMQVVFIIRNLTDTTKRGG